MKKLLLSLCLLLVARGAFAAPALQEGDIVFRSEKGNFAKAIQLATHSPYNHTGMVFIRHGKPYVLEAVQPVRFTSLDQWWDDGHCAAKRLKDAKTVLTPGVLHQMEGLADKSVGKKYSFNFIWSDNSFYCSGLVWRIYHETTGLELGKFRKLKDYDLSSTLVKKQLTKRFYVFWPMNQEIISPGEIYKSDLLVSIESKGE